MSSPRFTELSFIQATTDRLVSMLKELPFVDMSPQNKSQQSVEEVKESASAVTTPAQATQLQAEQAKAKKGEMQKWAKLIFPASQKIKPQDQIITTNLILDEIDRFDFFVNNSIGLGRDVLAAEKAAAKAGSVQGSISEAPAEEEKIAADDLLPFTVSLMPSNKKTLDMLLRKIDMLSQIIDLCIKHRDQHGAKTPYDLGKLSSEINILDSAVRVASLPFQKEALTGLNQFNYLETLSQEEREGRIQSGLKQDAKIEKKVADLKAAIANIDADPDYNMKYSNAKYKRLLFTIEALAGRVPVASGKPDESKVVEPMPSPASISSKASSQGQASVNTSTKSDSSLKLSREDAAHLEKFSGKGKVKRLYDTTSALAKSKEPHELRYYLTLIALITTLGETSERAYNVASLFGSPSTLRIELKKDLASQLDKKRYDSLIDYALYSSGSLTKADMDKMKQNSDEQWMVNVTVALFEKALNSAKTIPQNGLVSNAFHNFLEIKAKNHTFRDQILEALKKKNLYEPMMATAFPSEKIRRDVIKLYKLPALEAENSPTMSAGMKNQNS